MFNTLKVDTECNISIIDIGSFSNLKSEELLNGYAEHVRPKGLKQPYCMIVDEDGLIKELRYNLVGCYLYETHKHGHPIVGDIYIMKEENFDLVGLNDLDIMINLQFVYELAQKVKQALIDNSMSIDDI